MISNCIFFHFFQRCAIATSRKNFAETVGDSFPARCCWSLITEHCARRAIRKRVASLVLWSQGVQNNSARPLTLFVVARRLGDPDVGDSLALARADDARSLSVTTQLKRLICTFSRFSCSLDLRSFSCQQLTTLERARLYFLNWAAQNSRKERSIWYCTRPS